MKKYFFLFILLCPLSAISWTAYIYDDNKDVFTLYPDSLWSAKNLPLAGEDEFRPGTIGYIPTKLGYLEDEWYMWFDENNDVVVFKAFTQVPICALVTTEFPNGLLGKDEYNNLISGFDYKATFKIDRAIKGKIRQKFMEKALGQTAVDNCIADNVNQFRYYFKDGYLIDAESYDGLVGYAREFKGSKLFEVIQRNARNKHADEASVIKEINFQFDCFAKMPPEHFKLAYNDVYNYNMALVWFSLYGVEGNATLSNFQLCVPDAKPIDISTDSISMVWGSNIFEFKKGILVNVK